MDVLRRLRIKMIVSIVLVLMIVLTVLFFMLDFSLVKIETDKTNAFLNELILNDGHFPRPKNDIPFLGPRNDQPGDPRFNGMIRPDVPGTQLNEPNGGRPGPDFMDDQEVSRTILPMLFRLDPMDFRNYFSIHITDDPQKSEIIRDFPLNYTDDEILEIAQKITAQKKEKGLYDGMVYRVHANTDGSRLICVMNRQSEMSTLYQVFIISLWIYGISILVSFLLAWFFSLWAVRPVTAAFEKQKRFIADAGHELKTPIAVIGANIDVLMADMPDNKWLTYIRTENERMGHLVKDLLYLARSDADREELHFSSFDFTGAVNSAVLPFESVIFEQNKKLELNIAENMNYYGDEQKIKQVIIVLIDNAIKNSGAGALIRVQAYSDMQKIQVKVYNTGHGIAPEELEKIFLRFYRADTSRARQTGGYGLGLAIARTIAEAHHGTLTADSLYGQWAEFTLTLQPLNMHRKTGMA